MTRAKAVIDSLEEQVQGCHLSTTEEELIAREQSARVDFCQPPRDSCGQGKDHVRALLIDWVCIYFNTHESTPSFLSDAKRYRIQSLSLKSSRSSSPSSTGTVRSY